MVLNYDYNIVSAISPWVFLYVLGAFGLDAYAKQVKEEVGSSEGHIR